MSNLELIEGGAIDSAIWKIRRMDRKRAKEVLRWRYESPYDFYNPLVEQRSEWTEAFCDPKNAYFFLQGAEKETCAFCCFGAEARVEGGTYADSAVDIGLAVRPDLTGRGIGARFVGAILKFARNRYAPANFRVTVAVFNGRAKRVWKRAGFRFAERFVRGIDGHPFHVLVLRELQGGSLSSNYNHTLRRRLRRWGKVDGRA